MIRIHSGSSHGCSVERVNKAHKLIHSTVRSRLSNENVAMLIFWYVNMRLLRKDCNPFVSMIESAIVDEDGEMPEPDQEEIQEEEIQEDEEALLRDTRAAMHDSYTGVPDLNFELEDQ